MELYNKKLNEFVNLVDSDSPAPGGGSVAALISVLGISLSRMVGHLSINKKKFLNLDEETKQEFHKTLEFFLLVKERLIPLIDEDTLSFNKIMAAYRLKKDTKEEKLFRLKKVKEATLQAIKIPYEVANLSLDALKHVLPLLKYGNPQTASDLGVSILCLSSAVEGAIYNVLINLIGFDDQEVIVFYQNKAQEILQNTHVLKNQFLNEIYEKLHFQNKK